MARRPSYHGWCAGSSLTPQTRRPPSAGSVGAAPRRRGPPQPGPTRRRDETAQCFHPPYPQFAGVRVPPVTTGPYGRAAALYGERGWPSVLPEVPGGGVPRGFSGYAGGWPTPEQVAEWVEQDGDRAAALRLPPGYIGIDVDAYSGKSGAAWLTERTLELGPLPSTWTNTSRWVTGSESYDGVSGIRIYRVPPDVKLNPNPGPGVEIIQWFHRYVRAWPSENPRTGDQYFWYPPGQNVEYDDAPPLEWITAELPPAWLEYLTWDGSPATNGDHAGGGNRVPTDELTRIMLSEGCSGGRRDELFTQFAWRMARSGRSYRECELLVRTAWQLSDHSYPGEPFTEDDAMRKLLTAWEKRETTEDLPVWPRPEDSSATDVPPAESEVASGGVDRPVLPPPDKPYEVARVLLQARTSDFGVTLLRRWRGSWLAWSSENTWREVAHDELASDVGVTLAGSSFRRGPELVDWDPNRRRVGDVLAALEHLAVLPGNVEDPSWLGPDVDGADWSEVVAISGGLLNLRSRAVVDADPRFFTTTCLPVTRADWARAAEPRAWLNFLSSLWPDDPASVDALQEQFGYIVSGWNHLDKIPLWIGPPRSGRSTIARVLADLVGRRNAVTPLLESLRSRFGREPLIGKSLAVFADTRIEGSKSVVGQLLTISGRDPQTIDRKNRLPWTGELKVRFVIISNEIPDLRDASGAMASRLVPLRFTESWYGREDTSLYGRLQAELPGILRWSLDGADRVRLLGSLSVPDSARELAETLYDAGSPEARFVRERCDARADLEDATGIVYGAWKKWAEENGYHPGSSSTFGRHLYAMGVRRGGASTSRRYLGIRVQDAYRQPTWP